MDKVQSLIEHLMVLEINNVMVFLCQDGDLFDKKKLNTDCHKTAMATPKF